MACIFHATKNMNTGPLWDTIINSGDLSSQVQYHPQTVSQSL